MTYGIDFQIEIEEINDFENFNKNINLINNLKEFTKQIEEFNIGFSKDNVLVFSGIILGSSKKECKAKYNLIKEQYKNILKRYYEKFKLIPVKVLEFECLN